MNCKGCGKEIFPPKKSWCSRECMDIYTRKFRMSPEGIYLRYEASAKSRGKSFELTFGEFKQFWQVSCYYCGGEIKTIGLDRMDNSRGYLLDNVVPCCSQCNGLKFTGTTGELVAHCKQIVKHLG